MACLGRLLESRREKVEAHAESTGDKKIALVIENVRVDEIQAIMEFIRDRRAKEKKSR